MATLSLDRFPSAAIRLLRAVAAAAGWHRSPVLVGGAVRDAWRRRPTRDLDIAVARDALTIAGRVADHLGGSLIVLDRERGAARVLAGGFCLDVTDFRAPTLEGDLRARDYTVNALAVSLSDLLRHRRARIVDPTGGIDDLKAGRLRPPHAAVLADDPLRALRGVRLEASLGLALTGAAARAIGAVAPMIAAVAAERIRDEVLALLALPDTERALRRADALGLLSAIAPEVEPMRTLAQPAPHRFTVLEHSLRAVGSADRLLGRLDVLQPFGEDVAAHMSETVGGGVERRQVLKLGALFHDVSKPETARAVEGRIRFIEHDQRGAARVRTIGERWRLPGRAVDLLERLVRHHLRVMHLESAGALTPRARYRFFRDLGEDTRDVLLLTLADAAAVAGTSPIAVWRRARVVRDLFRGWEAAHEWAAAKPLVRGEEVMERYGLSPGPDVGRLLERAREAQALGLVSTREEALAYLDSSGDGP